MTTFSNFKKQSQRFMTIFGGVFVITTFNVLILTWIFWPYLVILKSNRSVLWLYLVSFFKLIIALKAVYIKIKTLRNVGLMSSADARTVGGSLGAINPPFCNICPLWFMNKSFFDILNLLVFLLIVGRVRFPKSWLCTNIFNRLKLHILIL